MVEGIELWGSPAGQHRAHQEARLQRVRAVGHTGQTTLLQEEARIGGHVRPQAALTHFPRQGGEGGGIALPVPHFRHSQGATKRGGATQM